MKTAPELAEFCDRQSGVRDRGDTIQLSNVNTSLVEVCRIQTKCKPSIQDIPEDQRYWLIHKGGYALTRLEEFQADGRVKVAVAGQHMVVDSTDVDRANPVRFARVADVASLPFLNETGTIHLLRQRLVFRKALSSNPANYNSVFLLLQSKFGFERFLCLLMFY